ncbi:MAG TPA: universal stress protein [Acidimicrobiales bacterium]|nr:universal stress protein [Acidimicrobiales bacterium]
MGTDGSERADRAVAHAAQLAAAGADRLVVVIAYSDHDSSEPGADRVPEDVKWATTPRVAAEEVARRSSQLARQQGASDVHVRAEAGEPTTVLLSVAEDCGAGLVVVGSKGMSSPSRFLLGSVPNNVSHHADRDVLIVRTD